MKLRTVIVTLEIETDLPVGDIRTDLRDFCRDSEIDLKQIQLNVMDATKKR